MFSLAFSAILLKKGFSCVFIDQCHKHDKNNVVSRGFPLPIIHISIELFFLYHILWDSILQRISPQTSFQNIHLKVYEIWS